MWFRATSAVHRFSFGKVNISAVCVMLLTEFAATDLEVEGGLMRVHEVSPQGSGRYRGVILYSEIFQLTGPIRRLAARVASMGYVVVVPEIFHEFEAPGTVLGYDAKGTDRGNWCKVNKRLEAYDADTRACVQFLGAHPRVERGRYGAIGFCIGGHLAFRAGFEPEVGAAACFYPTDIHKLEEHPRGLGLGMADDSLERVRRGEMRAALKMVWGRQDPHIPFAGRTQVRGVLEEAGVDYGWLEVNGAHAFMRDEGLRHDAALEGWFLEGVRDFFGETLRG